MQVKQEVIKELLLWLEDSPNIQEEYRHNDTDEAEEKIFNLLALEDAGLIEIGREPITNSAGQYLIIPQIRMTFQGSEYLQALKEKKVWEKVKDYSIETAKEVGKQLLISLAKDQAGLK